jgi:hypothetical protein
MRQSVGAAAAAKRALFLFQKSYRKPRLHTHTHAYYVQYMRGGALPFTSNPASVSRPHMDGRSFYPMQSAAAEQHLQLQRFFLRDEKRFK